MNTDTELPKGDQRKNYVKVMFNNIANRYDLLNHLLSFGIDHRWRKKTIAKLEVERNALVLDAASGTGDLAFEAIKQKSCKVIGIDLALKMLKIGTDKRTQKSYINELLLTNGDAERLPFRDDTFDSAMIAFGIRNMGNMQKALEEIRRTLKEGGPFVILEFSLPAFALLRSVYLFYFKNILPRLGRVVSGDKAAYTYLPDSVNDFPEIPEFIKILSQAGFVNIEHWKLLNGIAVIYRGVKSRNKSSK
jgi:demethylmenaquinone methyltransferase/2-methoxy-6-polyprenyl-1,4-benzoquinol methylase